MAWLSGWTKRIKLTIDNTKIDSTLSHFPVTVILSSTHGDCVFDELTSDANRKKIAVTQSDGTTQLYAEIEKWDDASESAVLHVSKSGWSISSSADTDFYLYYDSSKADNTTYIGDIASTPVASVWGANDKMVQHMVDDTTSTILDSTSNNNDGTKTAANEPVEALGKVGQGQDFDANDDKISISSSTSLNALGDFTFLGVVNLPALGSNKTYLFQDSGSTGRLQLWRYQDKCRCAIHGATYSSTLDVSAGDHMLVAVRSGSSLSLYLDDALLNSFTVATTALGSSGYLLGKYTPNTTYTLDGVFSEARIINTGHSLAWVKATYNSLWDTLLTYGSEEVTPPFADFEEPYTDAWFAQDFEELYGNRATPAQDFEELYGNRATPAQDFDELWSFPIDRDFEELYDIPLGDLLYNFVVEYYRNRATPEISIVEWYGNRGAPYAAIELPYSNMLGVVQSIVEPYENFVPVEIACDLPYTLLSNPMIAVEQPYVICGVQVFNDCEEVYTINDKDEVFAEITEFYSLLSGVTELQSFDIIVTVAGVVINPVSIKIDGTMNKYCLSFTMIVLTMEENLACAYKKIVTVTIGSDVFEFSLGHGYRTRAHGRTEYTIVGTSQTCMLGKLDAGSLLKVWDQGIMAKEVIQEVAGDYIDDVTHPGWFEGVDWAIPPNVLFANEESPLDVIRKLTRASGKVVQSYEDGTLRIRKVYPVSLSEWENVSADYTLTDEADFFSTIESPRLVNGFDKVLVSNQNVATSERILLEKENIDPNTERIKCYQVPWSGDFSLKTSGGDWVTIEALGDQEEEIEEVVEFIDGFGTTKKPVYEEYPADREWLHVQLGAVIFSENGNLSSEIKGQSLLRIKYLTKYKYFEAKSALIETVQFFVFEEEE